MSLQRRLTLFFVLIVILPLAVAGFVVQRVVVNEVSQRAIDGLTPALDATATLYQDRVEGLDARVRGTIGIADLSQSLRRDDPSEIADLLRARLDESPNLDFFIAYDQRGRRVAFETSPASFVKGLPLPSAEEIERVDQGAGPGFVTTPSIPVKVPGEGRIGAIRGGFWMDRDLLVGSSLEGVVLSIATDSLIVASTADLDEPVPVTPRFDDAFSADIGGSATAKALRLEGGMSIIASTPTAPVDALSKRVLTSLIALLLLAFVGTTLLAFLLARLITHPLEQLSRGAEAIADGRFDNRIETKSNDEIGRVADAFNEMSERLSDTISQLSRSRDQLQRAVRRVGETLRSTHDMNQMLGSILNTAVDAVEADGGILWRLTATRNDLYAGSIVGLDETTLGRIQMGEGVVGHVASRATNVRLNGTDPSAPKPLPHEPQMPVVIAVPVYSQDRVTGVLALYRNSADRPFTTGDLDTVVFLSEQGGVAIENVVLHEEARRLSLMDGLTGIWNRRFFQMQFRQVLATSQRFERPFSLLMMDLDFFKRVNDTYGHPRGDAVLVEFARRVSSALREVDTFARYGGEEFIVLLSETDVDGARTTADKICEAIRAEPFTASEEEPLDMTVSIGVASYPTHGDSFQELVDAADQALYSAKREGRNQVVVAPAAGGKGLRLARS